MGATLAQGGFLDGSTPVRGAAGLGTFSDRVVVNERAAVAVRSDLPPEQLATIGCAVLTGAGSAINLASIRAGDSVLVIGAGGIGLSGIQGARLQGALPIVALDPAATSRDTAITCGATHVFDPTENGVDEALMELTRGLGFDTVLDCVGSSATLDRAWAVSRRGGTIVEIGVPGPTVPVAIPLAQIPLSGKRLIGCVYGGSSVFRDIPRYVALAEAGAIDLGALVGRTASLVDVPELLAGPLGAGRTVIIL
jgi:S-(hydroxymethyl)glutathione dehydrogenase/alcohol dehydrogenase